MSAVVEVALSYAGRGWAVFPVHGVVSGECSCGRADCGHPGKHPCTVHGVQDATTDPEQIRELWRRYPIAGIAIAAGQRSGFLAIDVDPRNDGNQTLFELERTHGELPATLTSITGGGGSHLLFKYVDGVKNQTGCLGPGIDVKSNGGYIIAPPSSHQSGREYGWALGCGPDEVDAAVPPDWLVILLRDGDRPKSANGSLSETILQGRRNTCLTSLAGSMRRQGLSTDVIEPCLQQVNTMRCDPPLPVSEVSSIARSISRYPATVVPLVADANSRSEGGRSAIVHEPNQWPDPLTSDAFYGLAGDFVRLVEPHSEADPAALLIQFLVQFGNVIGRSAHFSVGADKHYTNIFSVLVGTTSKGRKGTSEGVVRSLLQPADPDWQKNRVMSGLASGEGLIWQVRDAIESSEPIREKGRVVDYQSVIADPGVDDKRLLVVEPEFARVLQVCEREANTLSAVIRQAWDSGELRTLTKKNAGRASGAHISVVGHITREELRRLLTDTAAVNGFANRFLWVCVRRSKLLPDGGDLDSIDFSTFRKDLAEAVAEARKATELKRSPDARELWHSVYGELSEGKSGLFGAATSRSEAQVMRLALIYALLDCSPFVRRPHLQAALAVWRYCEQSARFLFGDALGDPTADALLSALRVRPEGMTRLEIRDLFQRHKSSSEIGRALTFLTEHGVAGFQREESGGRPTERWFALGARKATEAQNHSGDTAQSAHWSR